MASPEETAAAVARLGASTPAPVPFQLSAPIDASTLPGEHQLFSVPRPASHANAAATDSRLPDGFGLNFSKHDAEAAGWGHLLQANDVCLRVHVPYSPCISLPVAIGAYWYCVKAGVRPFQAPSMPVVGPLAPGAPANLDVSLRGDPRPAPPQDDRLATVEAVVQQLWQMVEQQNAVLQKVAERLDPHPPQQPGVPL